MGNILPYGATLYNGKYVLEKVLGQGSFGVTYRASTQMSIAGDLGSLKTTVKVAVKEFFMNEMNARGADGSWVEGSDISMVQNYRRKFRKEAENLSHLNHPNIVKVLSIFDENNTTYYVMEYLEGESLDQRITSLGYMMEKDALGAIKQIGSALQYMHEHQMLHLDMKPGNIMCTNDGRIVLIDFGLSKQYDENGEPESSTTLGLGTMGYAPIEQADYRQDGTFPATLDIYALGATLFKMLTGKRPLSASELMNDEDFLQRNMNAVGVSPHTIDVVRKAMAFRRKDRYQSVKEFLEALSEPSVGTPVSESTEFRSPSVAAPVSESTELKFTVPQESVAEMLENSIPGKDKKKKTNNKPVAKPNKEPKNKPSEKPNKETKDKPNEKPNKKSHKGLIIGSILGVLAIVLIIVLVSGGKSEGGPDSPNADNSDYIRVRGMKVPDGLWYGRATLDSVMDGHGELRYSPDDKDGRETYNGRMKMGIRDGKGTLIYVNGITFDGFFENDAFVEGKFKNPIENVYFVGKFKDNAPYNGEWFHMNSNKKFADVVDGITKML
ncbi:MAG: protein kinase [Bacteroidales bacterium]|nr:protein kinase [Bacteroidales bacterium]